MPFAATWMDLDIIILSEVSQRKIPCDITYIWNLKNNTNNSIYKIETDSHIENNLQLAKGRDKLGVWD